MVMAMTAAITADTAIIMAAIMAARPSIITDATAADGAGAAAGVARVVAAGVMDMAARAVAPVVAAAMVGVDMAAVAGMAAAATAGVVDGADGTAGSVMEPAPFSRAGPYWTEGS